MRCIGTTRRRFERLDVSRTFVIETTPFPGFRGSPAKRPRCLREPAATPRPRDATSDQPLMTGGRRDRRTAPLGLKAEPAEIFSRAATRNWNLSSPAMHSALSRVDPASTAREDLFRLWRELAPIPPRRPTRPCAISRNGSRGPSMRTTSSGSAASAFYMVRRRKKIRFAAGGCACARQNGTTPRRPAGVAPPAPATHRTARGGAVWPRARAIRAARQSRQ